jgi:hypothetical protein
MRLALTIFVLLSQPSPGAVVHPNENSNGTSRAEQTQAKPAITNAQPKPNVQQPAAEERLASYTGWLMAFTGVLAVGTLGLFLVAWRQGKQIEREFLATHRPRLVLRHLTFVGNTTKDLPDPPLFRIEMANVGGVAAADVLLYLVVGTFNTGEPIEGQIIEEIEKAAPLGLVNLIGHGESEIFNVPLLPKGNTVFKHPWIVSGAQSVYFAGYVRYNDPQGNIVHKTGFLRRANLKARSFERVSSLPEFEYAD